MAKLEGGDLGVSNPQVSVQIAELDPANATPEMVVSFYTGGAHCCSDTTVLTQAKDGSSWQKVALGELDGGPLTAADLDRDGRYEFVPATTPSSIPSAAMPARWPRSRSSPSRTARRKT